MDKELVVSLKVAKLLQLAGWEYKTYFELSPKGHLWPSGGFLQFHKGAYEKPTPAPTASEIADVLPRGLKVVHYPDDAGGWCANRGGVTTVDHSTMQDALAYLWMELNNREEAAMI